MVEAWGTLARSLLLDVAVADIRSQLRGIAQSMGERVERLGLQLGGRRRRASTRVILARDARCKC